MAKFSLFDGGKVTIYSGPIHRVCADDFKLNKNGTIGFTKVQDKRKDVTGYFYVGEAKGGELTCIDEGYVLPNRNLAFKMCTDIVVKNTPALKDALTGKVDPKEASLLYKNVREESEVLYYEKNEVKPFGEQSKKDFKETLRQAEEERAKRKTKIKNKK